MSKIKVANPVVEIDGDEIAWLICEKDCNPDIHDPPRTARIVKYNENCSPILTEKEVIANSQIVIPKYDNEARHFSKHSSPTVCATPIYIMGSVTVVYKPHYIPH